LKRAGKFQRHHVLPHLEEGIQYFDIESIKRIKEVKRTDTCEAQTLMDPNTEEGSKFMEICMGSGLFDDPGIPGLAGHGQVAAPMLEGATEKKDATAEERKAERQRKREEKKKERAEKLKAMTGPERAPDFNRGVLADLNRCNKMILQLRHDKASEFLIKQLEEGTSSMEDEFLQIQRMLTATPLPSDVELKEIMVQTNSVLREVKPTCERCSTMLNSMTTKKRKREESQELDGM